MSSSPQSIPSHLGLRAGDWVVVRTREEILSTLDDSSCLDGLPFQPEMLAFCGQRLRVFKVAHKTCDTIHKTGGRRMINTVHLENARCDGASHGGCQADCIFFWKESWLRRDTDPAIKPSGDPRCSERTVHLRTRLPGQENSDDPNWVCQTTKLFDASMPLQWWDVRQYIRDVTSGNHSFAKVTKLLIFAGYRELVRLGHGYRVLVAFYNWFQKQRGGKPFPAEQGLIEDGKPTPTAVLDLKPGEWVEIRTPEEIMQTITRSGFNRGMRFDIELMQYCGEQHRVQMRVERLLHEQTGKMLTMKSPCLQLEDVYCRAECTPMRLGCPRAMNTYWREIWLKRIDPPTHLRS